MKNGRAAKNGAAETVPMSLYQDLLEKYHTLKRDSFVPQPEPVKIETDPDADLPQLVVEAIGMRSVDRKSKEQLQAYARSRLKIREEPDVIAAQILQGDSLDDE